MNLKRYRLRTLFAATTAICVICAGLRMCEFGYRPNYCESRMFVWVRCGPFCVDYSQSGPGFDRSYGPQVCLQYKHHCIHIPESCYRGT